MSKSKDESSKIRRKNSANLWIGLATGRSMTFLVFDGFNSRWRKEARYEGLTSVKGSELRTQK